MLLGALIVGLLTAYWLGVRASLWAAGAALVLLLVAALVPVLAMPIYVLMAIGVVVVCLLGSRRERPFDALPTARWMGATLRQAVSWLRSASTRADRWRKGPDDDKR